VLAPTFALITTIAHREMSAPDAPIAAAYRSAPPDTYFAHTSRVEGVRAVESVNNPG
jgi:hypothetical protein